MSLDGEISADQRDPWIGGGLPGDSELRTGDDETASMKVDDTADLEDDEPRPGCFQSLAQRSRTIGVEGDDAEDGSTQPAISGHAGAPWGVK